MTRIYGAVLDQGTTLICDHSEKDRAALLWRVCHVNVAVQKYAGGNISDGGGRGSVWGWKPRAVDYRLPLVECLFVVT